MTGIKHRPPGLTPEAWAGAHEDFIAERYGTTDRSIRRRAAIEAAKAG